MVKFNIDEYFCPVPGMDKEKDIVLFARRHWASYLGQIAMSLFLLLVPIFILILAKIYQPAVFEGVFLNFVIIGGSCYYLAVITFIFNSWISFYYDIYIVTKDLIVDITQQGFFNREIAQLSMLRVQDVSSKIKGVVPTLFAFGDVLVETAGEKKEQFLLQSVPNPQQFSAKILELHNQLVESDGRHRQMVEAEGISYSPKNDTPKQEPPQNNVSSGQMEQYCPPKDQAQAEFTKDDLNQGGEIKI